MKKSDIAALIFVASISVIIAYFVAGAFIGNPGEDTTTVKTLSEISAEVEEPDSSIFNEDAINPTVEVFIGDSKL